MTPERHAAVEYLEPGDRVGDLEIERELGRGAFGRVYLARDRLIDRRVALKVVRAVDTAERERLRVLREARVVGRLSSAHIVTLYRVHPPGPQDRGWIFEMEYVDGDSLDRRLDRPGPVPVDEVVTIAKGIADGLAAAHAAGVVHGDIKPGNILLGPEGVKLVDFGLSRILGEVSMSSFSTDSGLVGTPVYMAPEAVMGEQVTAASDIWSFGVVFYRMLAGRLPFRGRDLHSLFYAIQFTNPPPLGVEVPGNLARLAFECLLKDPAQRPAACSAILADLASGRRTGPAAPAPTRPRATRLVGRTAESERIDRLFATREAGAGGAVVVTGPTGVGKSALVQHAHGVALGCGFRWIEVTVTPLRGLLRPLLEAVRTVIDEERVVPADPRLFGSAADIVAQMLGEESAFRLENRAQALWALEHLLKGLAGDRALALLVEDAHHADAEDVRVLRHLMRYLPRYGTFLFLTCRTDHDGPAEELTTLEEAEHLDLAPLGREDAYRLLQQGARVPDVATDVAQRVHDICEGNPLFLLELLRHLEATGQVERVQESLRTGPNWRAADLPTRLQDLVTARLAGLEEDDRALLDVAAVDGIVFDGEAAAAVLDQPLLKVLRSLQRIFREHGLVVPSAAGYRFANALFQEAVYTDLAPELRRALHLQLALHLERREHVSPDRLGTHWERAGRAEQARPWLRRAAREAAGRQEFLRAIDYGRRAGLVGADLDDATALEDPQVVFDVATCHHHTGGRAEADALLDRLVRAAGAAGDEELVLRASVRRASLGFLASGHASVDDAVLRRAVESLPECVELGRARYLLGMLAKYRSELDVAERWFRLADGTFRALKLDARHAQAVDQLGSVALRAGRFGDAEALYTQAAQASRRAGQRANAAIQECNRCLVAFNVGRIDGLERDLRPLIDTLRLEGVRNLAAHATVHLARVVYALGRREEAEALVADVLATLEGGAYWPGLGFAHRELAHLVGVRGDTDAALDMLERARAAAREGDDHQAETNAGLVECHLRCWSGEPELARSAALRVAETVDPSLRPEAALWFAEGVLYGLDAGVLDQAAAWLEEDATPAVEHVRSAVAAAATWRRAGADPEPLQNGAAALSGAGVGARRAALRVVAGWMLAEAHRRRGNEAEATNAAGAALESARDIGHVWLVRGLESISPGS